MREGIELFTILCLATGGRGLKVMRVFARLTKKRAKTDLKRRKNGKIVAKNIYMK